MQKRIYKIEEEKKLDVVCGGIVAYIITSMIMPRK